MTTSPASSSMRSGKSSKASTPPSPPSSATTPRRLYSYGCMTHLSTQLMSSTSPCPPLLPINHSLITMRQRLRHMCGVREPADGKYERSKGVARLQLFRLLLCMAQRHLVIFSLARHSNILDHPLQHGEADVQELLGQHRESLVSVATSSASSSSPAARKSSTSA
ncbi:hypothetical protein FF1_046724 [Malus domestica]